VTKGWPILHVGAPPDVAADAWDLRVGGAVEHELLLSPADLKALPRVEVVTDFHCVTGWSHLDARWEGVRLATVLERATPRAGARFVRLSDGRAYDTTVPLALALAPDAILADREGGAPLPRLRGGPLRAVVPRLYGWKSCKWLRAIELLEEEQLGFWEVRGYANGADPWREERLV
jgi:DMSO/TMAO reductase YedYZ molybdopterin-dependent catalytic subunit